MKKLHLTSNVRVLQQGNHTAGEFSEELLKMDSGIMIFSSRLQQHDITADKLVLSLMDLTDKVFPKSSFNYFAVIWLCERAILAPTNESVNKLSLEVLQNLTDTNRLLLDQLIKQSIKVKPFNSLLNFVMIILIRDTTT